MEIGLYNIQNSPNIMAGNYVYSHTSRCDEIFTPESIGTYLVWCTVCKRVGYTHCNKLNRNVILVIKAKLYHTECH